MGSSGIYAALSGAMAQDLRMDTLANNIANANTPGYRKETPTFAEFVSAIEKPPEFMKTPKVPASPESFFDQASMEVSYVSPQGTFLDLAQGPIKNTGRELDIAIEGEGFFEVLTPNGVQWTRHGSFTRNQTGQLVTQDGYPVLAEGLPLQPVNERIIQIDTPDVQISSFGDVVADGDVVGRIALVETDSPDLLQRVGHRLFNSREAVFRPVANPNLHPGHLEGSNVNLVQEMSDLIESSRIFETTQRAIKAYDQINDKLINDLGKV